MRKTVGNITVAVFSGLADSYDQRDRAVQLSLKRPIPRGISSTTIWASAVVRFMLLGTWLVARASTGFSRWSSPSPQLRGVLQKRQGTGVPFLRVDEGPHTNQSRLGNELSSVGHPYTLLFSMFFVSFPWPFSFGSFLLGSKGKTQERTRKLWIIRDGDPWCRAIYRGVHESKTLQVVLVLHESLSNTWKPHVASKMVMTVEQLIWRRTYPNLVTNVKISDERTCAVTTDDNVGNRDSLYF
jgi:hypothetical protein